MANTNKPLTIQQIIQGARQAKTGAGQGGYDIYGDVEDPKLTSEQYQSFLTAIPDYLKSKGVKEGSREYNLAIEPNKFGQIQGGIHRAMSNEGYLSNLQGFGNTTNYAPSIGAQSLPTGDISKTNLADVPYRGVPEGEGIGISTGNGGTETTKSTYAKPSGIDLGEAIVGGSQFLDNLGYGIIQRQANKVPLPRPSASPYVNLDTKYNIDPALAAGRRSEQAVNKAIGEAGVSGQEGISSAIANRAQTLQQEGQLYGQKEQVETELGNQQRLMNLQVDAENRAKEDAYRGAQFDRKMQNFEATGKNIKNIQEDIQYLTTRADLNNYQNMDLLVKAMEHPEVMDYMITSGVFDKVIKDPKRRDILHKQLSDRFATTGHTKDKEALDILEGAGTSNTKSTSVTGVNTGINTDKLNTLSYAPTTGDEVRERKVNAAKGIIDTVGNKLQQTRQGMQERKATRQDLRAIRDDKSFKTAAIEALNVNNDPTDVILDFADIANVKLNAKDVEQLKVTNPEDHARLAQAIGAMTNQLNETTYKRDEYERDLAILIKQYTDKSTTLNNGSNYANVPSNTNR